MANKEHRNSIIKAVLWGIVSAILYLVLFSNQQQVTDYFTRGGTFAIAVLVTALLFSIVHGTFANYLIESLGIKAVKKGGH